MAIQWGAQRADSTNAFRVGVEFSQSPANITSSTTSVRVTARLYVGTKYPIQDTNNTFWWSGSAGSGSQSVSLLTYSGSAWSSSNVKLVRSISRTFNIGSSNVTTSVAVSMNGIEAIAGTASVSKSHTTLRKPDPAPSLLVPSPPHSFSAEYESDSRVSLDWVNNTSSQRPYTRVLISRWDSEEQSYQYLGSVHGSSSAYVDSSVIGNRRYRYRIRAQNSVGYSTDVLSNYLTTTPAPPEDMATHKLVGGDVYLWWKISHIHAMTGTQVEHRENGGSWALIATLTQSVQEWTHVSPDPMATHQYRIRAVAGSDTPVQYSSYVTSPVVEVNVPPATPTELSPAAGDSADGTDPINFRWKHNPLDRSVQTAFELQWRVDGGAWNTTVQEDYELEVWTMPVSTVPNGSTVDWQIRTKGTHAVYSPWSATVSFVTTAKPTVNILTDAAYWGLTDRVEIRWTYSDPDGNAQNRWEVELRDTGGEVLEARAGDNAATTSGTLTYRLEDDTTYVLRARARDSVGAWSDWDSQSISVDYAPPARPVITTSEFDVDEGTIRITIQAGTGGQVPTQSLNIYRQTGNGLWRIIAEDIAPGATAVDALPVFGPGTRNIYLAMARASSGESALSEPKEMIANPAGCDQWFWLNAGPDFATKARFRGNPAVSVTRGRDKTRRKYIGRQYALEYMSNLRNHDLAVSGTLEGLAYNSEEDFVRVNFLGAPVAYRDVRGRRLFCSIGDISFDEVDFSRFMEMSFNLHRVDYVEEDPLDLTYGETLEEVTSVASLYEIEQLVAEPGANLNAVGEGLFEIVRDAGLRMMFAEDEDNVYNPVQWIWDPQGGPL